MALPTPALCPCQPSLPLILAMPLTCCVAQLLHPVQSIPAQPPMCFLIFSFFRILFLCDKCCRRCQITYGERTPLLLPLLLLQPCMEGMVLGVLTKVPDFDIVFPSMGSFMLNFLTASTSSTPNESYENTQKLPLLVMRGQPIMGRMLLWVLLMVADVSHLSSVLYK